MNLKTPTKPAFALLIVFCLAIFLSLASPALAGSPAQAPTPTPAPDSAPTPMPGVPVKLGGETLFYVYQRIGPLTPVERAARIEKQIESLAADPFAPPLEITIAESDQGIDLMAGELIILTVTAGDAAAVDLTPQETAAKAAEIITEKVQAYRQQNTPVERAQRIFLALAILSGIFLALYVVDRFLSRKLDRLDDVPPGKPVSGAADLLHSRLFIRSIRLLFNLARVVIVITVLFIVVPFILRLFPITRELAGSLIAFLNSIFSSIWGWFTEYRSDLVTILIIFAATYGLSRLVTVIFAEIGQGAIRIGSFEPEWAPFTRKIINFLLLVGAVIVAFPYIPGSDTEAFQGVTIFLGALFTLASTAAVSNIVAGVIQTYTGAFRVGDVVRIGETTGIILQKSLLTTRLRTFKQEDVSIPNSVVMSASVVNYSNMARQTGVILYTTITIGYDVPWRTVHSLMLSAAASTAGILQNPAPFVLQTSLNDFHISYQLNSYTDHPEIMTRIYSELHANIQDAFNQAGVEIMSPGFTALRDGNTIAIPAENRPADYRAPGFRIEPPQ